MIGDAKASMVVKIADMLGMTDIPHVFEWSAIDNSYIGYKTT
ncbi:hypothetical protein [Teredinibacter purpureus]|nr:hypothetical protein [Teredinibacter purpureus]